MADKKASNVTRIKAKDSAKKSSKPASSAKVKSKADAKSAKAKSSKPTSAKATKKTSKKATKSAEKPRSKIIGYFVGSWHELKQVRWPNRRNTWSMTGALILFTAFFVTLILLIDYGFKSVFDLIYK